MSSKWIWSFGEFEVYHNKKLSCSRTEHGMTFPCQWMVNNNDITVKFYKEFHADTDFDFTVVTHAKGIFFLDCECYCGKVYNVNRPTRLTAGDHKIIVLLCDQNAFPSLYIDSKYLTTDESWRSSVVDGEYLPVGTIDKLCHANDDPAVFPFSHKSLIPVKIEETPDGVLYDFTDEFFGAVTLHGNAKNDLKITYGESKAEAQDHENAIITFDIDKSEADGKTLPENAFRYIHINDKDIAITAENQYISYECAEFYCDDRKMNDIFDICKNTFLLCSREVYLDGIKRDRWCWSGDAYQSFMVNRYLYNDNDIIKRTILSLLPKGTVSQHVNRINDYSALLLIAIYEYYEQSGDIEFINNIRNRIIALYKFIISRLDSRGYVTERPGDWVFIDWADIDKSDAPCAEQILLYHVYECLDKMKTVLDFDDDYKTKAKTLKYNIMRDYYSDEHGAFTDTPSSTHISRQANIFALLYDFADNKTAQKIYNSVLMNDDIDDITTPYFKFFEMCVHCKFGNVNAALDYIKSYWGGMTDLGATTVWEQFDPTMTGDEHFEMYGAKYGKSLCHAWGAGPIYIIGRYVAGIKQTGIGKYSVNPLCTAFNKFRYIMPINDGEIIVEINNNTANVSCKGKSVSFDGEKYIIE